MTGGFRTAASEIQFGSLRMTIFETIKIRKIPQLQNRSPMLENELRCLAHMKMNHVKCQGTHPGVPSGSTLRFRCTMGLTADEPAFEFSCLLHLSVTSECVSTSVVKANTSFCRSRDHGKQEQPCTLEPKHRRSRAKVGKTDSAILTRRSLHTFPGR